MFRNMSASEGVFRKVAAKHRLIKYNRSRLICYATICMLSTKNHFKPAISVNRRLCTNAERDLMTGKTCDFDVLYRTYFKFINEYFKHDFCKQHFIIRHKLFPNFWKQFLGTGILFKHARNYFGRCSPVALYGHLSCMASQT